MGGRGGDPVSVVLKLRNTGAQRGAVWERFALVAQTVLASPRHDYSITVSHMASRHDTPEWQAAIETNATNRTRQGVMPCYYPPLVGLSKRGGLAAGWGAVSLSTECTKFA